MSLFEKCRNYTQAREVQASGYYPYFRAIENSHDTEVVVEGHRKIMVGSNNYLGLTHHPKVMAAADAALRQYGSGCTGSRFLNGTLDLHEQLEQDLAEFLGKEDALIFSTGFQTNLGVIGALVGRNEHIFSDRLNHASIVDGCRLSHGETHKYHHSDMADLERLLKKVPEDAGKMIITDGIFSMEGDIADLPSLTELGKKYNAKVVVDDAHAFGVLGARGAGTAEHYGLVDDVDLIVTTFSKSLASIGGVVAGPEPVIHYLKHHARPLIFSASMPPSAVATVQAALDVLRSEPERVEKLWHNTRRMQEGLKALGYDIGTSETPVVPVVIGELDRMLVFWKEIFDAGVFTNPVTPPAVPEDSCRLRISLMATHEDHHVDQVLEAFAQVGKAMAVL
ncbi:MAG: pyridoxal phosphate-dependent aminotransferase family protein [Longimicrobiales bacterium]